MVKDNIKRDYPLLSGLNTDFSNRYKLLIIPICGINYDTSDFN